MSQINQAAFLDAKGAPLRVGDLPLPIPGPDDVVIENRAVAVNPVDWKIVDYGIMVSAFPFVLGTDVAGTVHEVGSNVTKFKKGDRVIGHCVGLASQKTQEGGFALYTAVPATTTAILPDTFSFAEGTVLPLALDTAAHGLYAPVSEGFIGLDYPSLNPTPSGKTLVVWGGSSSVGALAIQLAVASGAKVIATASKHNHDFCLKTGATAVIDYKSPAVVQDVVAAVKSAGGQFVGVYDSISTGDSTKPAFEVSLALGGGSVALTLPAPENVPQGIKTGPVFGINPLTHPVWEKYITPALEQGKLKCVPEPSIVGKGLEYIDQGLDVNRKGVSAKKVVIEL